MDAETVSFQFVASWVLFITILTFINRSRIGHVIIYYSLLLIILFILVTEYQQVAPLLSPITISEVNAKSLPSSTGGKF